MQVAVPTETIKEIADYLDTGMICCYHIPTGQLEYYPDEQRGHAGFEGETWQETIDKVESNYHEYIRFEGMENYESFRILENLLPL